MKVTPEALAAFAHSGKSPVAGPFTACEDLSIHAYSVIAHADREIGIAKSDLGLDAAGLCMLVRIADRFPCNAVSLVADDGGQLAGLALHDYAVLRL
jgi:hypothetical protein